MSILAKNQPNPLRFLLYLEWALLAIAIVVVCLQSHLSSLVAALLSLALLGGMGLYLPSNCQVCKVLYTFLEICLLLLWKWLVPHAQLWQFLDLVIVIRSYFLFGVVGRWLVTGFVFVLALVQNLLDFHHLPTLTWQTIQSNQLANLLLFGVTLLLGLQLSNFALVERQTRQQLQQSAQQMANFAALQQYNRQAWDFQYTLIYSLAAVNVQLQAALKLWQVNPAQAQRFLVVAHQQGTTAVLELRQSVRRLAEVLDGVTIEK